MEFTKQKATEKSFPNGCVISPTGTGLAKVCTEAKHLCLVIPQ